VTMTVYTIQYSRCHFKTVFYS